MWITCIVGKGGVSVTVYNTRVEGGGVHGGRERAMEESVKLAPGGTEGGGGHCWHQGSRVPEHELERAACQQTFQQPPTVTDFNPEVDRFPVQSPNLDFQRDFFENAFGAAFGGSPGAPGEGAFSKES